MQNKPVKISAVIITLNEEKNIARCIQSLQMVADEIVVVDSFSTDRTREICRELQVRFVEHAFEDYIKQMNFAVTQAQYDYMLSLDADEALSETLQKSISAVKSHWTQDGYTFNRLTSYCGHWIRHSGWYPDKKLRLYDRRKGQWEGVNPHYSFRMTANSKVSQLEGDLLHYSFYTIEEHLAQTNKFSSLVAQEYFKKGKKVRFLLHLFLYPPLIFIKRYILQLGFLDGYAGYVICKNTAYYKFLKYAKLKALHDLEKK